MVDGIKIKGLAFKTPLVWLVHEEHDILFELGLLLLELLITDSSASVVFYFGQEGFHQLGDKVRILSVLGLQVESWPDLHDGFLHILVYFVLYFFHFLLLARGWHILGPVETIQLLPPEDLLVIHIVQHFLLLSFVILIIVLCPFFFVQFSLFLVLLGEVQKRNPVFLLMQMVVYLWGIMTTNIHEDVFVVEH